MTADLFNGLYEFGGALACGFNVLRAYKDKVFRGVSILPVAFFSSWGYWNLYYYPHLNQWFSFIGGCCLVAMNTAWLWQMIYYKRKNENRT